MSQDRYSLFPCEFYYAGPTTLHLGQIMSVGVRPDSKKSVIVPAGMIDPQAVILAHADPRVVITTDDLLTALTPVSITAGLACPTGALLQYQKRSDGGTFAGGATNTLLTSKKGFLYPKSLSADQDDEKGCVLELEFAAQWDGSTSGTPALPVPPLVIAVNAALTGAADFNSRYYMGPVYANAVLQDGVAGWKIDFGIEYKTRRFNGDVWPQVGSIVKRTPRLSYRIMKTDLMSVVGSLFNAAAPGAIALYARAGSSGAARVSDATAGHVKITAATSAWAAEEWEVEGEDDATVTVGVDVTGTLALSTASTIP